MSILSFIYFFRNIPLCIENANPDDILERETERVPIYNYVSACQNPITWRRFMKINEIYGMTVPSTHVLWYYFFFLNKHKLVHNIFAIFLHIIPAIIVDTMLLLSGQKPM